MEGAVGTPVLRVKHAMQNGSPYDFHHPKCSTMSKHSRGNTSGPKTGGDDPIPGMGGDGDGTAEGVGEWERGLLPFQL